MRKHTSLTELQPGQVIEWIDPAEAKTWGWEAASEAMYVVEVRPIPEADWQDAERELIAANPERMPPTALTIKPVRGGDEEHWRFKASYLPPTFIVLPDHRAVCADCGGLWPCRHARNDRTADANAAALDDSCVVCKRPCGSSRQATVHKEIRPGVVVTAKYHTRKGSPCRTAYLREVAADRIALAAIRREDAVYQPQGSAS